jgi:hypothetical protein
VNKAIEAGSYKKLDRLVARFKNRGLPLALIEVVEIYTFVQPLDHVPFNFLFTEGENLPRFTGLTPKAHSRSRHAIATVLENYGAV